MDRRLFLLGVAAAGLSPLPLRADRGWSAVDTATPIYLAGKVRAARWRARRASLLIVPDDPLVLPADLRARTLPAQSANVHGGALLARTRVPGRVADEWTLELGPPFRLHAWRIPEIGAGEWVEAIGYPLRMNNPPAVLHVEYLFYGGRAYGLRSAPA